MMLWLVCTILLLQRKFGESSGNPLSAVCSSGYNGLWLNNTQSCFVLYPSVINQTSWNQAQSSCANGRTNINIGQIARLANIYDATTWSALAPWLVNNSNFSTNGVWFGLYEVSVATSSSVTDWKWINYQNGFQSSLSTSNLTSMNVTISLNGSINCVAIINRTYWQSISCSQYLPYLCELYSVSLPSYQLCPYEWVQVGQQCYMPLWSIQNSWLNSQTACTAIGGNLPTFQTSLDWNNFQNYRNGLALSQDRVWIGANASATSYTVYNNIDGSPFVSTFWSSNTTTSSLMLCAMSIWNNDPAYQWSNRYCTGGGGIGNAYAICQIKCQSPFKLSFGLCILTSGTTTDFYGGVQTCEAQNASLPIFHNSPQWQSFFQFISLQNMSADFWVGVVQTYASTYWTNIDFSGNPNYYNWTSGYPTTTGNCGVAKFLSHTMVNQDCMSTNNAICMYRPAISWTTCPKVNDSYSMNWQINSYRNKAVCYRYLPEESPTDFITAAKKCAAINGNLPSMYSGVQEYWDLARYAGVLNSTENLVPNNVWLGTTQQMEQGVWQSIVGSLTNFSVPWFVGNSSNQVKNFAFANMLQNSTWNTDTIGGLHHVICEYRLGFKPLIDTSVCLNNLTSPTYYDTRNTDVNGAACLPWISSSNDTAYLPNNYCRDPFLNSTTGPWCYTSPGVQGGCFYDPCSSSPCLNNGTCVNSCQNYTCICMPLYYGINCEFMVTSSSTTSSTSTTILSTPWISTSSSTVSTTSPLTSYSSSSSTSFATTSFSTSTGALPTTSASTLLSTTALDTSSLSSSYTTNTSALSTTIGTSSSTSSVAVSTSSATTTASDTSSLSSSYTTNTSALSTTIGTSSSTSSVAVSTSSATTTASDTSSLSSSYTTNTSALSTTIGTSSSTSSVAVSTSSATTTALDTSSLSSSYTTNTSALSTTIGASSGTSSVAVSTSSATTVSTSFNSLLQTSSSPIMITSTSNTSPSTSYGTSTSTSSDTTKIPANTSLSPMPSTIFFDTSAYSLTQTSASPTATSLFSSVTTSTTPSTMSSSFGQTSYSTSAGTSYSTSTSTSTSPESSTFYLSSPGISTLQTAGMSSSSSSTTISSTTSPSTSSVLTTSSSLLLSQAPSSTLSAASETSLATSAETSSIAASSQPSSSGALSTTAFDTSSSPPISTSSFGPPSSASTITTPTMTTTYETSIFTPSTFNTFSSSKISSLTLSSTLLTVGTTTSVVSPATTDLLMSSGTSSATPTTLAETSTNDGTTTLTSSFPTEGLTLSESTSSMPSSALTMLTQNSTLASIDPSISFETTVVNSNISMAASTELLQQTMPGIDTPQATADSTVAESSSPQDAYFTSTYLNLVNSGFPTSLSESNGSTQVSVTPDLIVSTVSPLLKTTYFETTIDLIMETPLLVATGSEVSTNSEDATFPTTDDINDSTVSITTREALPDDNMNPTITDVQFSMISNGPNEGTITDLSIASPSIAAIESFTTIFPSGTVTPTTNKPAIATTQTFNTNSSNTTTVESSTEKHVVETSSKTITMINQSFASSVQVTTGSPLVITPLNDGSVSSMSSSKIFSTNAAGTAAIPMMSMSTTNVRSIGEKYSSRTTSEIITSQSKKTASFSTSTNKDPTFFISLLSSTSANTKSIVEVEITNPWLSSISSARFTPAVTNLPLQQVSNSFLTSKGDMNDKSISPDKSQRTTRSAVDDILKFSINPQFTANVSLGSNSNFTELNQSTVDYKNQNVTATTAALTNVEAHVTTTTSNNFVTTISSTITSNLNGIQSNDSITKSNMATANSAGLAFVNSTVTTNQSMMSVLTTMIPQEITSSKMLKTATQILTKPAVSSYSISSSLVPTLNDLATPLNSSASLSTSTGLELSTVLESKVTLTHELTSRSPSSTSLGASATTDNGKLGQKETVNQHVITTETTMTQYLIKSQRTTNLDPSEKTGVTKDLTTTSGRMLSSSPSYPLPLQSTTNSTFKTLYLTAIGGDHALTKNPANESLSSFTALSEPTMLINGSPVKQTESIYSPTKSVLSSTTVSMLDTIQKSLNSSFASPASTSAKVLQSTSATAVQEVTKQSHSVGNIDNKEPIQNLQSQTARNTKLHSSTAIAPYHLMTDIEFIASAVIQTLGCIYILACIGLTLFLFVLFRNFNVEKIIVVNQDIALFIAHCFIMTLREPRMYGEMDETVCKIVAIGLQYFFTAAYMFMLLEGLQMMVIVARIKLNGSLMPWYINMVIGWGTPLIILLVSAALLRKDEYTTHWSCWGSLHDHFGLVIFIPMITICCVTAVIVESAGIMSRNDPKSLQRLTEPRQLLSALISQRGIVFVMASTVCSHSFGLLATYFQSVVLYMACFIFNIISGFAIFTFHTAMDENIRTFIVKTRARMKTCCSKITGNKT